ncbi:MAG: hypothetical protein ABIV13_05235 [Fimbriimonadales bacterium]
MHAFLTSLVVLTAQASTIDYGNQTINPPQVEALGTIGWSNDESHWAWDSGLNGGGAFAAAERTVVSTRGSATKAYWMWDEGDSQGQAAWLDAASADTFAALGLTGAGPAHLIYQFQPSFFQSNFKLKPFSQLKSQYTFTLQSVNHTVSVEQVWEPNWTAASPGPGAARYKRAKVIVRVDGNPIGKTEYDEVAGYSINRIYLSPSRDCIAVSLARFTMTWFEGLNFTAEHQGFTGRYR